MDYHSHIFYDFSLIVLENDKWIAVLPANVSENILYSHQGLTYGGLLHDEKLKLEGVIAVFRTILKFLNDKKILKLSLKLIPAIYNKKPSDEIKYALFLAEAKLFRCDSLTVLDLANKNEITSGRIEGIKKGKKANLEIKEEDTLDSFWNAILIPNLLLKHNAKPVHNLEEISKLKLLFANNIRQFNVYQDNIIVAGTTIFETDRVAHAQYISGNDTKSRNGSLDYLFHFLITEVFKNKSFFDFGTSNENNGRKLNSGLNFWKEGFGASTIVQDFYEVETTNFNLLENIII